MNITINFQKNQEKYEYKIYENGEELTGIKAWQIVPEGQQKEFYEFVDGKFAEWLHQQGLEPKADKLPKGLLPNLLNRGHSIIDIENMDSESILTEALEWVGIRGWGPTIYGWCKGLMEMEKEEAKQY